MSAPTPKIDFFFDFETRSRQDLPQVGAMRYAVCASTSPTCITWCFGRHGDVKAWRMGEPIPAELVDIAKNPWKYNFKAYNLEFDYLIWVLKFIPLCGGGVNPSLENLEDAMAITNYYKVGGSLEAVALAMGYTQGKDKEGRLIMLKSCKPGRDGNFPELTEEEWEKLIRYAKIDTQLLRDIYYRLPRMPESELFLWRWTFTTNITGIQIDVDLANELRDIVRDALPPLEKEFSDLTGGLSMRSVKCQDYFRQWIPSLKDLTAATVRDLMMERETLLPPEPRRALEIKSEAGSTSISKIPTIFKMLVSGRVYNILQYAKAHTLRWSGSGIQIQNFPRVNYKALDDMPECNRSDLASYIHFALRPSLKEPILFVKNLLRKVIIPSPGKTLYSGDWSKMEPTTLFWLLDLGPIPPKWYEEMAAKIYNIPIEQVTKDSREREIGKEVNLAGGYGMGAKTFKERLYVNTGRTISTDEAKTMIYTYRNENPKVVELWGLLESAFLRAINGEIVSVCNGKVIFEPMTSPLPGVRVKLPSGVYLHYPHAAQRTVKFQEDIITYVGGVPTVVGKQTVEKIALSYYQYEKSGPVVKTVYGGLLCENVVSAIARCCMGPAIWKLQQLGFDVLAQIHDEIISESYAGRDKEYEDAMCYKDFWNRDMHIAADVQSGVRYLK